MLQWGRGRTGKNARIPSNRFRAVFGLEAVQVSLILAYFGRLRQNGTTSRAQDIQSRAISAAAKPASSSDKYQSGFFFTTRQIGPIAIEI